MPNIPLPCTNCLRFHYGACREAPKQCFQCGGFNHIERYCPFGRRVPVERRGPLPGTRAWCQIFGLDEDPGLKIKVLNALKTSPGCSIWVNERCIYQGNEHHFTQDDPAPRGRSLEDRITRGRSRSPRVQKRSLSPPGGFDWYGNGPNSSRPESFNPNDRFRARTPTRQRSPSPAPKCALRIYASGSNAMPVKPRVYRQVIPSPQLNHSNTIPRPALASLGDITNILRPVNFAQKPAIQNPTANTGIQRAPELLIEKEQTYCEPMIEVEDPYFVLGVTEGAAEVEITDAYQQRMWEIDLERMADGVMTEPGATPSVYDESIKILNAAKRQLVGY